MWGGSHGVYKCTLYCVENCFGRKYNEVDNNLENSMNTKHKLSVFTLYCFLRFVTMKASSAA